jgi:hypothetical protein
MSDRFYRCKRISMLDVWMCSRRQGRRLFVQHIAAASREPTQRMWMRSSDSTHTNVTQGVRVLTPRTGGRSFLTSWLTLSVVCREIPRQYFKLSHDYFLAYYSHSSSIYHTAACRDPLLGNDRETNNETRLGNRFLVSKFANTFLRQRIHKRQ